MKTPSGRSAIALCFLAAACAGENAASTPPAAATGGPLATAGAVPKKSPPSATPPRADPSLIPRQALYSTSGLRIGLTMSPDGKSLAFLADVDGVFNVMVAPADDLTKAKAATHDRSRPVFDYFWSASSDAILYAQDNAGDGKYHVYAVTLATGDAKDLTP